MQELLKRLDAVRCEHQDYIKRAVLELDEVLGALDFLSFLGGQFETEV